MTLSDRFRSLRDRLADKFEWPVVTITRTSTVRTDADRAAGRKGSTVTVTESARGILGARTIRESDGTMRQEATVRIDHPVQNGDQLTIDTRTVTVLTVEEINPYGEATAILYLAVVK